MSDDSGGSMDFKDYYKARGLESDADDKAVNATYCKLSQKYHLDVSKAKDAANKFNEIAELKNAEKRVEYDQLRKYGQLGQAFESPPEWQSRGHTGFSDHASASSEYSDFFNSLFGRARSFHIADHRCPRRGQGIEIALPLLQEEALADGTKTIAFQLPHYGGEGQLLPAINKTINNKTPPGVRNGERIRLKGLGAPGFGGGANGDLYLQLQLVPHPLFDVEGHNLIATVPLAPWEAALGSQITVPTLKGKIKLRIPANTQTGQRLRIKGKGLSNKLGEPGDQYALFQIVIPAEGDEPAGALWAQLAGQAAFNPRAQWGQ